MTSPATWRRAALITLAAVALLTGLHFVPSAGGLSHLDFVPGGPDALQFCDSANPQFLSVVARSSPVTIALAPASPPEAGKRVRVILTLKTATGKPIGLGDLLPTATQKILLLAVDPELRDFQTLSPGPGEPPGWWIFSFIPQRAGTYRIFADFTPAATGREMYASADLTVGAGSGSVAADSSLAAPGGDYRFDLQPAAQPIYARQPVDLRLSINATGGGMVPLIPDLGTFGHLTAFDRDRTGLVNVHSPRAGTPDPFRPGLTFRVTFPDPGHYVIWSQVSLNGRVTRTPFPIDVLP